MTVKASYAYVEEMRVASMWSEAVKTGVEAGIMEEDLRGDVCVCCVCVCVACRRLAVQSSLGGFTGVMSSLGGEQLCPARRALFWEAAGG